MSFIINQITKLKEFWKWRDPRHRFVNLQEKVPVTWSKHLKQGLTQLYQDKAKKIIDLIDKSITKDFTFHDLALLLHTKIKI